LRSGPTPQITILDISQVPYMDSAGMGLVMNQYVHCKTKGLKLIVAGANSRVMDLFEVTKVSTILPLAATVEEAEARA
jgi:anti-sigma B factor antagonist